ncbi:hypothetical protein FE257_007215 [Aspergillus nanangensis]|uniref:CBM-cenC domain-containing protein n=1 Tax=Aspergillus nanangensis TaxID=2582783 RepID=A0AAD4CMY6_ASPNN|nr:hypothetical protein FE257_007215 [Aspergillus nanangensis]
MALSPLCHNVLANPSFETGSLSPWWPTAVDVAQISNGSTAYSGDFYLDLQTAVGNRGNAISQRLTGLHVGANYTFSVQIQTRSPSAANYCGFFAYTGRNATTNAIASELLYEPGEWVQLTGSYVPKRPEDVLHVGGSCTFSGSSYTGHVLLDDIFLGRGEDCSVVLD